MRITMLYTLLLSCLAVQCTAYVVHPKEPRAVVVQPKVVVKPRKKISKAPESDTTSHRENTVIPSSDKASRQKWGIDKNHDDEYWFNSKIHTLGNTGLLGALHAAMAPGCTKLIDAWAYNGVDIRSKVAHELADTFKKSKIRVLDMCCGVGMSTRALRNAFPRAETVVGVDTSPEMISMARLIARQDSIVNPLQKFVDVHRARMTRSIKNTTRAARKAYENVTWPGFATFQTSNAERTPFPSKSFDLVTIMYAFHEAPRTGRNRILSEVRRLLQSGGTLALIDISPDYSPSPSMLAGEPYVKEYQKNIQSQLNSLRGFTKAAYKTLIPGHVGMWTLRRL